MKVNINPRFFKSFDWLTFAVIIVLAIIGIATIYSATRPITAPEHPDFYLKQMVWLSISVAALLIVISFDYVWLYRFSMPLYGVGFFLLVFVLFVGRTTMGAQRWISLGPLSFQPSEFFRVVFIIAAAAFLSRSGQHIQKDVFLKSLVLFGIIPLALLIKQPDLGTAVLLATILVTLLLSKGVSRRVITVVVIVALISVPFVGHILWEGLKDYQKNRIIAFMDPDVDPAGIGYNINQSKISIGSGGLFGKGYLKGTQGPLRFLPEKHTDFIFAVYSEEWGFAGSLFLVAVYLVLFLRGLDTAVKAKDEFGRLLATGITFMFFIYFFVNIGMTLGMMPVVGVPLPFVSYGGTALLSNFIAAGILINIRTRRFELFYP